MNRYILTTIPQQNQQKQQPKSLPRSARKGGDRKYRPRNGMMNVIANAGGAQCSPPQLAGNALRHAGPVTSVASLNIIVILLRACAVPPSKN